MKPSAYPATLEQIETVKKIKRFLLKHLLENPTIEEIADHCHTKPYFVEVRFTQICNETIVEYRRKYRLLKAVKLIASGLPGKQAAHEIQYTEKAFYKAFKKEFSLSPAEYIEKKLKVLPEK